MSQDTVTDKTREANLLEESLNRLPGDIDMRGKPGLRGKTGLRVLEMREKNKRGIGVLRTRPKHKIPIGEEEAACAECYSGDNFTSQYEDESPVNYSLKYSETESCKAIKADDSKKKFKDYPDYAEDQPTNFSLKYAERTCDEENKNPGFNYFDSTKSQFKAYSDYLETDLDQPTDFTLKYRESVEEEIKNPEFTYYDNGKSKSSSVASIQVEESASDRVSECYTCEDETPLMFSRCSSMNSLSSFVHITQSIPDDRSSIVSDFSRMPSGIISPSELPDSPTQTAPSSPKRQKPTTTFLSKPDFLAKKSVFEDDVATYRQEDTPIEFSRTTSLSSLNIDSPVKSELMPSSTLSSIGCAKENNHVSVKQFRPELFKDQMLPEKIKQVKEDFETTSGLEVDEGLLSDCISIDIQKNGLENCDGLRSQIFTALHNVSPQSPNSMGFVESEEIVSEGPDNDYISSKTETENTVYWDGKASPNPPYECDSAEDNLKNYPGERVVNSANIDFDSYEPLTAFEEALIEQCIRWGMPHKGEVTDETRFKGFNKCEIDETEQVDGSSKISPHKVKCFNRKKTHTDRRSAPWSTDLAGGRGRTATSVLSTDNFDFDSNEPLTPFEEALLEQCIRLGMPQKKECPKLKGGGFSPLEAGAEGDNKDSSEQITPLETALLEQCIRMGMPQKRIHRRVDGNNFTEEHNKIMSCTAAQLNRLKINSDNEKDNKKCDHIVCMCRRKHGNRRKTVGCGRLKKCKDVNRSDNYKT